MLSLHTNAASLSTQNSLGSTNKALGSSMTKLGTGYRVNTAMDDAAGLQIATRLNAQTRGMQVAQKNTQNAISMIQTAEGGLNELSNMLLRMKDLATESATATTSQADKDALSMEYKEILKEAKLILTNTKFGDQTLLAGAASWEIQVGAGSAEQYTVAASAVSLGTVTADIASAANGKAAIGTLDTAIAAVGTARSQFGAAANVLEHTYNNLGNMVQNTQTAQGRIMDVDYAAETSNMMKKQMIMQASTSMLKQSNSMSQMIGSLLQ